MAQTSIENFASEIAEAKRLAEENGGYWWDYPEVSGYSGWEFSKIDLNNATETERILIDALRDCINRINNG